MGEFWGYHMMLDCRYCNENVSNNEAIANFARDLVVQIDMKAYGDPQVVHFAEHDLDKSGYTLVQLIETSNICAHFCDSTRNAYFDIFSCKPFSLEKAEECVRAHFAPESIRVNFVTRQA